MGLLNITEAEVAFLADLDGFVDELSAHSSTIEVENTDPRCVSLMLHKRLTSNYRGFMMLWEEGRSLEAAILLRCAIECTICIAANHAVQEDFYPLLLGDLVATMKNQIKLWRDDNFEQLVKNGEARLRALAPRAPDKPHAFDWQELAAIGGQLPLYGYHKSLSIAAAHVTAISIMRGVVGADGAAVDLQDDWRDIERPKLARQMMIAMVVGLRLHAEVIGSDKFAAAGKAFDERLNEISKDWVGDD